MKRFRVLLTNYFGFSKVESNASVVLISIVIGAAIVPRFYFNYLESNMGRSFAQDSVKIAQWNEQVAASLIVARKEDREKRDNELFSFDPNNVTKADLKKLGFRDFVAQRIVNYRNAGGSFSQKEDLLKIYGIDTAHLSELQPYIDIKIQPPSPATGPESGERVVASVPRGEISEEKTEKIDLNLATNEALQSIRGIGPYYASQIIKYRDALGGFISMDQLKEIYRIRPETIEVLRRNTVLTGENHHSINVNADSIKFLSRHPYINWNQAKAIFKYRKQHGDYQHITDIRRIKIISDSLYQKISPYLSVEP